MVQFRATEAAAEDSPLTLANYLVFAGAYPGGGDRWPPTTSDVSLIEGAGAFGITVTDSGLPYLPDAGVIEVVPVLRARLRGALYVAGLDYDVVADADTRSSWVRWRTHAADSVVTDIEESKVFADVIGIAQVTGLWEVFLGAVPAETAQYLREHVGDAHELRHRLATIIWCLLAGPTPVALSAGIVALMGAAYAIEPGQVIQTHLADGRHGVQVIGINGIREYAVDEDLDLAVSIGDVVTQWQPLSEGAVVADWVNSRSRVLSACESELQQYGRVIALIPLTDALASDWDAASDSVRALLSYALPVWVGAANALVQALVRLRDRLNIRDDVYGVGYRDGVLPATTMTVSEPFAGRRLIRYGGDDQGDLATYGEEGIRYDQQAWDRLPDVLRLRLVNESEDETYTGIDRDGVPFELAPGASTEIVAEDTAEFNYVFIFVVSGADAVVSLRGTDYPVPIGETSVTTSLTTPTGTFDLIFTNTSMTTTLTLNFNGTDYEIAAGDTVTITVAIPPTP
jgi:hypothetical protein